MHKLYPYWKSLTWSMLMLVLFLMPGRSFSHAPSFPGISEIVHILMFSVFTVLLLNDFQGYGKGFFPRIRLIRHIYLKILLLVVLGSIGFGIAVEILQHLMKLGRSAELKDIAYDVIGILIGLLYVWISRKFFPSKKLKD